MLKNSILSFYACSKLFPKSKLMTNFIKSDGSSSVYACELCNRMSFTKIRSIHTSLPRKGGEDRRQLSATMPKKDEGAEGEKSIDIDMLIKSKDDMFPDIELPNRLFNGTPFKELPIVNIKATKNNTIINLTDSKGNIKLLNSCGLEGFKNTRKGTNIAAQATAISLSSKLVALGYNIVRVRVQGLGPGRMSAIKGLQMAGLTVISITDNTKVFWEGGERPRKQRRL